MTRPIAPPAAPRVQLLDLPNEALLNVIEHVGGDAGSSRSTAASADPVRAARDQARHALRARASIPLINSFFRDMYYASLRTAKNAECGFLHTNGALARCASLPEQEFAPRVKSVVDRSSHIEADLEAFSPAQVQTFFSALRAKAATPGNTLPNLRLLTGERDLVATEQFLGALRAAHGNHCPAIEWHCRFAGPDVTIPPDLRGYRELTAVRLQACQNLLDPPVFGDNPNLVSVEILDATEMNRAPDFSGLPELAKVTLSRCLQLAVPPDFSRNTKLAHVRIQMCPLLQQPPVFGNNPELVLVDLGHCALTEPPDFSECKHLAILNLRGCGELRTAPDLSCLENLEILKLDAPAITVTPDLENNAALKSLDLSGCVALTTPLSLERNRELVSLKLKGNPAAVVPLDFRDNPKLEDIDLSSCADLTGPPDFGRNPALVSVNLSNCTALEAGPDFSNNPNLRSVQLQGCARLSSAPKFASYASLAIVDIGGCAAIPPDQIRELREGLQARLKTRPPRHGQRRLSRPA